MLVRLILSVCFFYALKLAAFQPELSDSQCARFLAEFKLLEVNMGAAQGPKLASMSNRYGRLQERINVFCPALAGQMELTTAKPLAEPDASNIESEQQTRPLYSDPEKQFAWENFYSQPEHCLNENTSSETLSRCQQEQAQFQHVFEQQWLQNNGSVEEVVHTQGENNPEATSQQPDSPKAKVDLSRQLVANSQKKHVEPVIINDFTLEQSSGLDTLWIYIEDYIVLLVLLIIILISWRALLPLLKTVLTRHFGSVLVDRYLSKHLSVSDYRLYSKITLPISGGEVLIDELIVSRFGIFILSCQSQMGKIYADTTSDTWTEQVGKKRLHFANPLMQLPTKEAGIKQLFEIQDNIFTLAVFDQVADFRTNIPQHVCQMGQLLKYITRYEDAVFTNEQVEHFSLLLSEYKTTNPFHELLGKMKKNKQESEWGI